MGEPEEKRPLGKPRCRWEDNIKMDLSSGLKQSRNEADTSLYCQGQEWWNYTSTSPLSILIYGIFKDAVSSLHYTGCCRNNSHISKNHCGVPKGGSGVWSVPLGRVHNKVFSRRHAVVG
jgi:hypothetical protein